MSILPATRTARKKAIREAAGVYLKLRSTFGYVYKINVTKTQALELLKDTHIDEWVVKSLPDKHITIAGS